MIDRQSLIALQPSVQKLITSLAQDCVVHLNEEATHTDAYALDAPRVDQALFNLESEFSSSFIDQKFLEKATEKSNARVARRDVVYNDTVCTIALPSLIDWRSHVDTILKGLFNPRSCVEAYNACKSHGMESDHEPTNVSI
jgi:hypothetical protein